MDIQKNISLKKFSHLGIGGNADFFAEISNKTDLIYAVDFAKKYSQKMFFLGGGSNIVFSDKGFRGIVFHFTNKCISYFGNGRFIAEAGTTMGEIFGYTKKIGRDFSLLSTIPGTIGGATVGNAGVPEIEMKDIFISATLYDTKEKRFLNNTPTSFFDFQYRKTCFHLPKIFQRYIIWEVEFQLKKRSPQEIENALKQYFQVRKRKQPWGKTAGSFFANPPQYSAGYLLDRVGMKGEQIGDAFFSPKHANFLVNKKNASQKDVLKLARLGKQKVFEKFHITLYPEVKILNELGEKIPL